MDYRLGTSFHETFALNLPAMSKILDAVAATSNATNSTLRELTSLGPNYIRSMPRYCYGSGLLSKDRTLTPLARVVLKNDRNLVSPLTHWLIHYFMSAQAGPGPLFWHILATRHFRPGSMLDKDRARSAIKECSKSLGRELGDRTASATSTAFLGSYTKSDALGSLHILSPAGTNEYQVLSPSPPPLPVFAYTLAVSWEKRWGDVSGINLSTLSEEGGLASIFVMGSSSINQYVTELQNKGILTAQLRTPPFQITRRWGSVSELLEMIYE